MRYSGDYFTNEDVYNFLGYNDIEHSYENSRSTDYGDMYTYIINDLDRFNITILEDVEDFLENKDNVFDNTSIDNFQKNNDGDYLIHNLLIESCDSGSLIDLMKYGIGHYRRKTTCDDVCTVNDYMTFLEDKGYEISFVEDIDIDVTLHRISFDGAEYLKPYRSIIFNWIKGNNSGQAAVIQVDEDGGKGSIESYVLADEYLVPIENIGVLSNNIILILDTHGNSNGLRSDFVKLGFYEVE